MHIKFSNRRLWSIMAIELIVIAVIFLFLWLMNMNHAGLAVLFLVLIIVSVGLAVYLYGMPQRDYVTLSLEQIVVFSVVPFKAKSLSCTSVRRVVQRGNRLSIVAEEGDEIAINLNQMNADDIKRLLMYIRYSPVLKSKFL